MQTSLLRMEEVQRGFFEGKKSCPVLKNITAQFEQGRTYAITGVSGTGKSTFIHLLAGLDTPTSGVISFNGRNLQSFSAQEHDLFLQKDVGLLFQQPYLIKELTVFENIVLAGRIAQRDEEIVKKEAIALLRSMGMEERKDSFPGALSGGQQTRVALGRGLINRPAFLLADEPTGNLDEQTADEVLKLLLEMQKKWNMGLIISTHDAKVAHAMQEQYRIHDGHLTRTA